MKKTQIIILFALLVLFGKSLNAQVGINTTTPNASSILDVYSENKGILFPRMTTVQKLAIISPQDGLMVYDTDLHAHYIYIDGVWRLQRKEIVFPNRIFTTAQFLSNGGEISTPTAGNNMEIESNAKFSAVNVLMTTGTVSGPAILSPGNNPMKISTAGTYLFKISGRFRKSPVNDLNMKTRIILNINGVNKLNTWFHLPNAANASSTKTNFIMLNLAVGDEISVQVKKDRFTDTASAGLHGIFSDLILEIEKLP